MLSLVVAWIDVVQNVVGFALGLWFECVACCLFGSGVNWCYYFGFYGVGSVLWLCFDCVCVLIIGGCCLVAGFCVCLLVFCCYCGFCSLFWFVGCWLFVCLLLVVFVGGCGSAWL